VLIGEARGEARGPARPALLMLVNGEAEDRLFSLPSGNWRPLLDSTRADGAPAAERAAGGSPSDFHAATLSATAARSRSRS
jgi:hypothetical protein